MEHVVMFVCIKVQLQTVLCYSYTWTWTWHSCKHSVYGNQYQYL